MTNLKDLTPAQWEKFTSEVAERLLQTYPVTKRGALYGEFLHPEVEDFTGRVWEGSERDLWYEDINKKYRKLKKTQKIKL